MYICISTLFVLFILSHVYNILTIYPWIGELWCMRLPPGQLWCWNVSAGWVTNLSHIFRHLFATVKQLFRISFVAYHLARVRARIGTNS